MIGKIQDSQYYIPDPTPIEKLFYEAAIDKIPNLEREISFGDLDKKNRYRVDFLVRDKKVVIELDGHDYHSTKPQREEDAKRQRYLEKAGYRVIRFTGSEVYRDVNKCVQETIEYLDSLSIQYPIHRQVMYIDYLFLEKQIDKYCNFYKKLYPKKSLKKPTLLPVIIEILNHLKIKSDCDVLVFYVDFTDFPNYILKEAFAAKEYERGRLRIEVVKADLIAWEILEHLSYHSHYFDNFILVGDDRAYISFLETIQLSTEYTNRLRIARLGNDETVLIGGGMEKIKWQNVWYMIGTAMGLSYDEL